MLWKNLLFQETNTHQTNGNSINTIVSDPVSQAENIWQVQPLNVLSDFFRSTDTKFHFLSLSHLQEFTRHVYNQACFYCSCLQKCKTQIIQNIEEYTIYSCYKLKWCICGELVLTFKTGSLTSLCGKEANNKQTKSQKLDFQYIHTLNTIESIFYSLSLLSTDVFLSMMSKLYLPLQEQACK